MRKQLYLDIITAIKTITDDAGEQIFKHFDLWNRQIEFLAKETPFNFPAIFVEFAPLRWETLSEKEQSCNPVVRIHVVTEFFYNTADNNPDHLKALDNLDLPDRLFDVLSNLDSDGVISLERLNTITNHDHEGIIDSIEEYQCRYLN